MVWFFDKFVHFWSELQRFQSKLILFDSKANNFRVISAKHLEAKFLNKTRHENFCKKLSKLFHNLVNFSNRQQNTKFFINIWILKLKWTRIKKFYKNFHTISKNILEQNIKKIEATESPKFLPNMIRKLIIKMDRRQNVLKNFQIWKIQNDQGDQA